MRKLFLTVLIFSLIMGPAALSHAGGAPEKKITATRRTATAKKGGAVPYKLAVGNKAARGTKNVLFGWTEIPKRVVDITQETNNPFWGLLAGTFEGTLKAMARTVSGVSDVVTAPIAADKDPLIQADIDLE
jgi:putative exosortase-associated protein (TIGR04073 family)